MLKNLITSALLASGALAQGPVLVITPNMRAAVFGAGGTLAQLARQGRPVYIAVFGNEEKQSANLGPAETRLANNEEGERAAKILGAKEVINLGHKSGEFAYISSSEMRNQVMTLTRLSKPEILFFPDWYVHYQDDHDIYRAGRMAEESPYGGSSYFLQEMSYLGHPGAAARQYYFFVPYRPYRPREGGEGQATMKRVDISDVMAVKLRAIEELKTSNQPNATEFAEELAETIGRKFNARYGEEFNHLRPVPGLPAHIRERVRSR